MTLQNTLDYLNKQANSVELPTTYVSGQYRAKHGETQGVCNEHRLAPKGMMCSEHSRNRVSVAEMSTPVLN